MKKTETYEGKNTYRTVEVSKPFTNDELIEKGNQLADIEGHIENLEERKKLYNDSYKAEKQGFETDRKRLTAQIKSKSYYTSIRALQLTDLQGGNYYYIDEDECTIVKVQRLTADERENPNLLQGEQAELNLMIWFGKITQAIIGKLATDVKEVVYSSIDELIAKYGKYLSKEDAEQLEYMAARMTAFSDKKEKERKGDDKPKQIEETSTKKGTGRRKKKPNTKKDLPKDGDVVDITPVDEDPKPPTNE